MFTPSSCFFLKKVIVISHKLEYSMLKYKTVCSVVNIMLLPAKDSLQGKKKKFKPLDSSKGLSECTIIDLHALSISLKVDNVDQQVNIW